MSDRQLEHIIKQTLAAYKPDVQPDWNQFKAQYNVAKEAETLSPSELDMRSKLQDYQSGTSPQWSAFLTKREAVRLEESTSSFDTQIESTLEGYTSNTAPNWAAFKEFNHKYAEHQNTISFDEKMRERVEQYRAASIAPWSAFVAYRLNHEAGLENQDFDSRIQDELKGYETDTTPQWDAFQSYKDSQGNQDSDNFDQVLKDKLDNFQPSVAANWSNFLSKRQPTESGGSASAFDKEVAEKLHDYRVTSEPQWEKLLAKKRKADAVATNGNFDSSVQQVINNYSRRYNSAHWLQLKARLEKIAHLRKQIFTFKTMEMVFVCLMAFTLGNHLKYLTGYTLPSEPMAEVSTPVIKTDEVQTDELQNTNTDTQHENAANRIEAVANNSNISSTTQTNIQSGQPSSNSSISLRGDDGDRFGDGGGSDTYSAIPSPSNKEVLAPTTKESNELAKPTLASEASSANRAMPLEALISIDGRGLYTDLASLTKANLPQTAQAEYFDSRAKPQYRDEGNWLHVFNSIDNYYITTPNDDGLPSTTHEKFGYSLEILHSWQRKNFEIEAGLGYSFVNYEPIFDAFTYSYQRKERFLDFEEIKLDLITAPINVKYHFVSNGRWSVFGGVGLDNNLIARTEYGIVDSVVVDFPIGCQQGMICSELPDFYNNEFTEGLFGQAPTSDIATIATRRNAYLLRGSVSIGAERNVSDNIAVYLRSTYSHTLYDNGGIGPFGDELNKWAIGMGFKLRLR